MASLQKECFVGPRSLHKDHLDISSSSDHSIPKRLTEKAVE